jgi:hypothetical protein
VKSTITGLFVALGVTAIAASAAPAPQAAPKLTKCEEQQQVKFKNSAPADEYFGSMKLSYLGMNNTFRDSAISSGDHTIDPGIIHKVELAENALEAWGKKYPRDPQLARTYFLATQVDRKIWTKNNQELAWKYMNRVVQLFPGTFFGKTLKADLAKGFTQHYYALPVPCTTPVPSAPPDPNATVTPAGAFAAPSPDASPTIEPTPTPKPTPQITQAAKNLRIEVIPQPCVPPPTPSPSPSPSASASPAPDATASAATSPAAVPTGATTPAVPVPAPPTPSPR